MKKNLLRLTLVIAFGCTVSANTPIHQEKKEVNVEESVLVWKAYKVFGSHTGTIDIKKGSLIFTEGKLSGGEIIVDMLSMANTDLEGGLKTKLENHLRSDDFFGVTTHPTAKFVFTTIKASEKNAYQGIGDISIKGITKTVTFDISIYGNKATATMKLDRSQYDIGYGTGSFFEGLGDRTMYDEFNLLIDLVF